MQLPTQPTQPSALSVETRHSAMLLGGALAVMGLLALLLFVITNGSAV